MWNVISSTENHKIYKVVRVFIIIFKCLLNVTDNNSYCIIWCHFVMCLIKAKIEKDITYKSNWISCCWSCWWKIYYFSVCVGRGGGRGKGSERKTATLARGLQTDAASPIKHWWIRTIYSQTSIIRTSVNYLDFSIIWTFSLVLILSWIFISHDQDTQQYSFYLKTTALKSAIKSRFALLLESKSSTDWLRVELFMCT